jgi:N-acetylmuramoyl-L-alanine amidase
VPASSDRKPDPYALRPGERFARREGERRAAARRRNRIVLISGALIALGAAALVTLLSRANSSARDDQVARRATQPSHTAAVPPGAPSRSTTALPETTPPVVAPTTNTPSRPTTSRLGSVRDQTIVIDPGHNGGNYAHSAEINQLVDAGTLTKPCDTTGTETAAGYTESSYNLDVALRLAEILRAAGAKVILTRSTDTGWGPCITERAALGNRAHAAVAISIHADGGPATGRGFHVIYPPSVPGLTDDIAANSYRLALDVRRRFTVGTGMPYSSYIGRAGLDERADLGGLNLSDVPKVFIETGNMRNAEDVALLSAASFRQKEAMALATALSDFLGRR